MSKKIIALKIDVSKIDKDRLFKGSKGLYLDAVLFYDEEEDQYGQNGMITQSVTKEEREKGVKGAILGNAKVIGGQQANVIPSNFNDLKDDLPFIWLLLLVPSMLGMLNMVA